MINPTLHTNSNAEYDDMSIILSLSLYLFPLLSYGFPPFLLLFSLLLSLNLLLIHYIS